MSWENKTLVSYCISGSVIHGEALRQQIERTVSTDTAEREAMREKEVRLGLFPDRY